MLHVAKQFKHFSNLVSTRLYYQFKNIHIHPEYICNQYEITHNIQFNSAVAQSNFQFNKFNTSCKSRFMSYPIARNRQRDAFRASGGM